MKPEKFNNLIQPVIDKLFRLALRITGNKQDAEDVVQDVLVSVWQKQNESGVVENLESYCYRATRNKALDVIALMENRNESLPETFEIPLQDDDVQKRLEKEELITFLTKQIEKLPEKSRTIFHLREVEGLGYREIADVMQISEDQVKVTLFRVRQKIKNYFAQLK